MHYCSTNCINSVELELRSIKDCSKDIDQALQIRTSEFHSFDLLRIAQNGFRNHKLECMVRCTQGYCIYQG